MLFVKNGRNVDPRETVSVEFFRDDTPGHRCDKDTRERSNDDHRMCSDIGIPTCATARPGVQVSARCVWDQLTRYHTELGRRDFSTL